MLIRLKIMPQPKTALNNKFVSAILAIQYKYFCVILSFMVFYNILFCRFQAL